MDDVVGRGRLNSQSPKTAKHYAWVGGGLVVKTFCGINECFLIVNIRVILCPTPRVGGSGLCVFGL